MITRRSGFLAVLFGALISVPSLSLAIDQDDPAWVGVWTFEEGAGSTSEDVVNGNEATLNGEFAWDDGVNGTSIQAFGGGSIDVAASESLGTLVEEITVAGWFRIDEASNTGLRQNGAFLLEDQSDSEPVPDGWSFRIWTDQGLSPGIYGTTELFQDQWYHVAGTYDGGQMELYINGVPESAFGLLDASGGDTDGEWTGDLAIAGNANPVQLKFGPEDFTGAMDEVMILNRALSIEEIQQILEGWDRLAGDVVGCDFDGNGSCDIGDLDGLMGEIISGGNAAAFDLTGDGAVNGDDRDAWLSSAGPYLPGDANLDGTVNAADLNVVGLNWQGDSNNWSDGNFDGTPGVTASDLNVVGLNWQKSAAPAAATNAVPEPSTGWMLGVLMVMFGAMRRR